MTRPITHPGLLAMSLAVALAASGAGTAQPSHAAVTLGSALATEPNGVTQCSSPGETRGCLAIDDVLPGRNLVAPFRGVVVRWRTRLGDATQAQSVRIRVVRRIAALEFTVISSGELERVPAGMGTYTFPARLPISSGDQVGIDAENDAVIEWRAPLAGARAFEYASRPIDGADTGGPTFINNNEEHTFNADVEPDADGDGFGDETQDQCPGQAGPDRGCPPGTLPAPDDGVPPDNDFSFGKVKKNKRKGTAKLTVKNLPGLGELELAKTKKVKGKEKTADASKEKLPIKPKGKARKKLNRTGTAKVKAKVTYTPDGGEPNTKSKKLKLKKR